MWNWLTKLFRHSQTTARLGDRGENVAAKHLESQGFRILARQHRGHYGEVDLIAIDGDTIVFVEVKTRASSSAGDPTEAVDRTKQRKITRSALAFLKQKGWLERRCRFDVVAILWDGGNGQPTLRHYRSAFDATDSGQMYS
ncbi:MAG TPA: YraN family protein [Schlesneria sp.]